MRIACLAWGSLIWKTGPLVLASEWRADGPSLPIEFVREGDGGELATALSPGSPDTQTFWALLATSTLAAAREALRLREQIPVDRPEAVGSVPPIGDPGPFDTRIADWARSHGLDAVVWTALPPRSKGIEGRMPSADEATAYLSGLRGDTGEHAEQYVRRMPVSFRTPYRAAFERALRWTADEAASESAG